MYVAPPVGVSVGTSGAVVGVASNVEVGIGVWVIVGVAVKVGVGGTLVGVGVEVIEGFIKLGPITTSSKATS